MLKIASFTGWHLSKVLNGLLMLIDEFMIKC